MVLRWLRRSLAALILLVALYVTATVLLNLIQRDGIASTGDAYRFYACDNGVHVDLVLPVATPGRDWRSYFPAGDFSGDVTGAGFVSLGWGARGFFANTPRWQDMRPGPVFKALFWLDESVLHVSYHGDPATEPNCRPLATDAAGQLRLFAFIDSSLGGPPRREDLAGYGPNDAFYAAKGRYSLFRTCNIWSADALTAAGQPIGLWSPFSFQVIGWLSE